MPGELSDDDAYKINVPKSAMEKRRKQLKIAREKAGETDEKLNHEKDGFEVVPREKVIEDYDINTLAETMALAKKMLRKKNRDEIIDNSYSRYAINDDEGLPDWFLKDER